MADLVLLAGISLCVLSLFVAVIELWRLLVPRGAAALFVLGIMIIGIAAWISPDGVSLRDIGSAWHRITSWAR